MGGIMKTTKPPALIMSGHCATAHLTRKPDEAHVRCRMERCPHAFHYAERDQYECANETCPYPLVETEWVNVDPDDVDEDGNPEPVYTHLDHDGHAIGEMCPG